MYRTIIKLKKELSQEMINEVTSIALDHYDNFAGKLDNISKDPYVILFEGVSEKDFACMDLGTVNLAGSDFLQYVSEWNFFDDENPCDNCDVLKLYLYGVE
jgi:hypothetical protein